ncbi:MAG TPA: hypothetical protein VN851_04020 [Thermoanaerobaculia bacterium]|nr:hypothetical protein [Thermoanaerobaculia bacterium]
MELDVSLLWQGLYRRCRFLKRGAQRITGGESLVEASRELGGNRVANGLRGGDHHRDSGVKEALDLPLGGAAIQKNKRQSPLRAQESGEARGMDYPGLSFRRLEQQLTASSVAAEVKDRHPVAVARVQEHVEHLRGRGVGAFYDLAEARPFRDGHGRMHPALLFGEIA